MESIRLPVFGTFSDEGPAKNLPFNHAVNSEVLSMVPHVAEWLSAAGNVAVASELDAQNGRIARAVRQHRPLCIASGCCCHFEAFGHRLFLTGLEAAWTWARLQGTPTRVEIASSFERGRCPFLVRHGADSTGRCGIHAIRPAACRLFFCDPKAASWERELYEECHQAIRSIHQRFALTYRYAEWRVLLAALAAHSGT